MVRVLEGAERHTSVLLALILLLDIFVALRTSLESVLWHDELFTYAISQAPTLRDLMMEIRSIDLNPPLSYLLTRASFHLFGVGTLQCRLPEMLGFLLAVAAIFFFVRRRAGNSYGFLASSMLVASAAGTATVQSRPYGLMLGFTALALLAWQRSCDAEGEGHPSRLDDLLLGVALCLLLLSHVFGLLGWAAIAFAEGVAALRRRRVSPARTVALLAPLAVTLLYGPLLRDHGRAVFPPAFQPHLFVIFNYYVTMLGDASTALWLAVAALLLWGKREWFRGGATFAFNLPEWVCAAALFALPAVLMLRLLLQHAAFFPRYGLLGCLGVALLFPAIFQWIAGGRPAAALLAGGLVLFISGHLTLAGRAALTGHVLRHTEPAIVPLHLEALPDASLPVVAASGLTFVEMNYRETPAMLARTWYLTGGETAIQYAHANIFESMALEKQLFRFRANVDEYKHFTAEHERFYVVGTVDYPEDWLLRKLMADGATLVLRRQTPGAYRDSDIYEVTLRR